MVEKIRIKDLVLEGTPIDELKETLFNYMRNGLIVNQTEFQFSFADRLYPGVDKLKQELRQELDNSNAGAIQFDFIDFTPFDNDAQVAGTIALAIESREIDMESGYNQLKSLAEVALKQNNSCTLDFSAVVINTGSGAPTLSHTEFKILTPETVLVLARLMSDYGDKLNLIGIEYHSGLAKDYAFNYFTMPHYTRVEDVHEFVQSTYQVNDLVCVVDLSLDKDKIYSDVLGRPDKYRKYNPAEILKSFTRKDVFRKTSIDYNNIRLGIISGITDKGVEILRISIRNAKTRTDLQVGRFLYDISSEPEIIAYEDLMNKMYSLHCMAMDESCSMVYSLTANLKPNEPRPCRLYYSRENAQAYLSYLDTFTKQGITRKNGIPSVDMLREQLQPAKAYYDPSDLVK